MEGACVCQSIRSVYLVIGCLECAPKQVPGGADAANERALLTGCCQGMERKMEKKWVRVGQLRLEN